MAKAIAKLYELKGIKRGGDRKSEEIKETDRHFDREEVAEQLGKSPREVTKLATTGKNLIKETVS